METLNKISLYGLSSVLMFSLAITADAASISDKQAVDTTTVVKKSEYPVLDKKQLRERYERLKHRTTLGKITDKNAYK
ncbi:MAG TPA: hypothetical protein DDX15_00255 [Gammaproteobacteria bacterium]|nr:hypothetical protein [Gammaproteobacteria bacterium]|tara:strand:+ start:95 stop:328 length:234 start_codon:yes stop_codon:yes gene_type:complete